MRKVIALLGVFLIIVAFIVFIFIPIVSFSGRMRGHITVHPDSHYVEALSLPKDADVKGTINEVTGDLGQIDFYVFDESNYNLWINGSSYSKYFFIYKAENGSTFSFRTDKADDYYFVFDHPDGLVDRYVNWSGAYKYKPYAPYAIPVAVLLGVLGAVVLAVGSLKQKEGVPTPTVQ